MKYQALLVGRVQNIVGWTTVIEFMFADDYNRLVVEKLVEDADSNAHCARVKSAVAKLYPDCIFAVQVRVVNRLKPKRE